MRAGFLLLAALVLSSCGGDEPREAPPPPPAKAAGIRPLTAHGEEAPSGESPQSPALAPAGEGVSGTVEVAPGLKTLVPPRAVLFLIARSAETHQIVAVRKEVEFVLPFSFQISGRDAMMEGTSFSGPLEITARLSKTGEALPSAGDIEGVARGVAPNARGLVITLDALRR